jgi:hypothetical protein
VAGKASHLQSRGTKDFGEVINPAPQDICIVNRTEGKIIFSTIPLPNRAPATSVNPAYIPAGINRKGEIKDPVTRDATVPRKANGGARYR